MSRDDDIDIDPDAKMRVRGKLEAHFPNIPNPEQYDPMNALSRLLNLAEGTYQGRTVQEFMRHHVGEPYSSPTGRITKDEPQLQSLPLSTPEADRLREAWIKAWNEPKED